MTGQLKSSHPRLALILMAGLLITGCAHPKDAPAYRYLTSAEEYAEENPLTGVTSEIWKWWRIPNEWWPSHMLTCDEREGCNGNMGMERDMGGCDLTVGALIDCHFPVRVREWSKTASLRQYPAIRFPLPQELRWKQGDSLYIKE